MRDGIWWTISRMGRLDHLLVLSVLVLERCERGYTSTTPAYACIPAWNAVLSNSSSPATAAVRNLPKTRALYDVAWPRESASACVPTPCCKIWLSGALFGVYRLP